MARLDGRVAVVTGGAGGIGSVTCRRLAAEGASVAVADIDIAGARRVAGEIGSAAIAVEFDATEEDSIRALFERVVEEWGTVHVLHNNAALTDDEVLKRDKWLAEADVEVWDAAYANNLRGYVLGCKYAIPHMLAAGGGVIVQMSSDAALVGAFAMAAYGCTKAAVVALTQYVATQYGKQGIRCIGISPGAIMTQNMYSHMGDEGIADLKRHHLTDYIGEPNDIASLVAFLASDEAKFITGITIPCDGGFLAHLPTFAEWYQVPSEAAV